MLNRDTLSLIIKGNIQNCPLRYKRVPFIFIHINMNGGTSIARSIGLPFKLHFISEEVRSIVGTLNWQKAFISFVRNPFDKAVSHFKYRVTTKQIEGTLSQPDFEKWIVNIFGILLKNPLLDTPKMFLSQVDWLSVSGELDMDFIRRFENIKADFDRIKEKIGVSSELPYLNKSKQKDDCKSYHTNVTKEIILNYFQSDLDRFEYDF